MFKRSHAERPGEGFGGGALVERCPKCGATEVIGDYCQRCRVKISTYRVYLASLGKRAPRESAGTRRWFGGFRIASGGQAPASADRRTDYEDRALQKIYRELHYPATARGVYLVVLTLHLTTAGRVVSLRLTVDPPNADVAQSVRTAVSRAQPFPLPPPAAPTGETERITLAFTVSI